MFAGIGGFRAGLDRAGGFQCVGHCEIDKYADASYRAIHDIRREERYYMENPLFAEMPMFPKVLL
ncbi:DNA cytosine methyltransferase [Flavonifractor sp. An306]|uniref:DNA cytosine methyltransferase n=1 Tax=Flavonifractor sp. An306 TaxID=1965629 RepID=UPI0031BAFD03